MAEVMISAVGIKKLWYADCNTIQSDLTGTALNTLLSGSSVKEIKNVHQDTWQIEETEASQDKFKNQLTGNVYRMGSKEMGEVSIQFTIGQYDYHTKAALLGGEATDTTWKRARGKVEINKVIIGLTEDDQYVVFPQANINTREANTDKAIGLAVTATALEPKNEEVSPEYWFDISEVHPSSGGGTGQGTGGVGDNTEQPEAGS